LSTAALDLKTLILNGRDAGKHYADLAEGITSCTVRQTITGASTVDLSIADARRTLVQSAALTERSRLVLDRAGYTLVKVAKSGGRVNLTFEDDAVAELRTHNSYKKIAASTMTRPAFVTSLIREVPSIKVVVAPGASKSLNELARGSGSPTKGSSKVISGGQVVDSGSEDTWTAAARIMGEINWRVFCYRGTITIAPDSWLMAHNGKAWDLNPTSPGVHDIDFNWDVGKPAATATITADVGIPRPRPRPARHVLQAGHRQRQVARGEHRPQPLLQARHGHHGPPAARPPGARRSRRQRRRRLDLRPGLRARAEPLVRRVRLRLRPRRGRHQSGRPVRPDGTRPAGQALRVRHARPGQLRLRRLHLLVRQAGRPQRSPTRSAVRSALCRQRGTTLTVEQAIRTRGALIFRQRGGGANDHVVISLGDGTTIEARGRAYGVVICKVYGRDWTSGGYVPGMHVVAAPARGSGKAV
jgi:hypothetical protein